MKIIHYKEIEPRHYESETAQNAWGRVCIGQADGARNFCMRVFEFGEEGCSALHSHDFEHEVFVHQGQGEVWLEGEASSLEPGTALFIPAGLEHQLKNTGPDPLVFVCCIPSGFPEL